MSDQSELERFVHTPHEVHYQRSLVCLLEHLNPAQFLQNRVLLDALRGFFARATADELVSLVPHRSQADSNSMRLTPLRLSRPITRLQQVTSDSPRRTVPFGFDTPSLQRWGRVLRDSRSSSPSRAAPSPTRLDLSDSLFVPTQSSVESARSTPATANIGAPTLSHSTPPSIFDDGGASTPKRRSMQRLVKLLRTLPRSDHYVPAEVKTQPQKLWGDRGSVLPQGNHEDDSNERCQRLRKGQKCCLDETKMLRIRRLILRILQVNEHEIVRSRLTGAPHVDEELADKFDMPIRHVKRLRAENKRNLAVMAAFGPGATFGGGDTDWSSLSDSQCQIFISYVQRFRPDWIQLVQSLNYVAGVAILTASSRVGTSWESLRDSHSQVASIVMQYVEVVGEEFCPRQSSTPPPITPTASMLGAVSELHQLVEIPALNDDEPNPLPTDSCAAGEESSDTGSISSLELDERDRSDGDSRLDSIVTDASFTDATNKRKARQDLSPEERPPKQTRTQAYPEQDHEAMDIDNYLAQQDHVTGLENVFLNYQPENRS